MKLVLARLVAATAVMLAMVAAMLPASPNAHAQGSLSISLFENPFVCDTIVRPLGTVSGLIPGEGVEFSSPQLNGAFSLRTADALGQVEMRWNCDGPKTWSINVRGLSSGNSASFTLTGAAAPAPADAPIGAAFDAKSAMTTEQMAIWKDFSPFSSVGVYIDVNSNWDNRADKIQNNLTASWVSTVFADGWRIIPIYVGFQAPDQCATGRFEGLSLDPGTARNQGLASAADAVASVAALGIGPGNPIYYDMEAYRSGCAEAVLAFLDAWTEGVHAEGYLSGVYGSRSSTMADLSRTLGRAGFDAPDAVWVSTGNGQPGSFGLEIPSDGQWTNARLHQYRLNITRTYGGVTRQIDENIVNGPLAGPGTSSVQVPAAPTQSTTDSDGDGVGEPEPDNCDNVANPDQSDIDGDGDGDVCDRDIDGDGVDNVMDFAPTDPAIADVPVATPEPTAIVVAEIIDTDGDGVGEPEPDNCDNVANPDQADLDNDGDGDVCDGDIDGDGVANEPDQDPLDPFVGALPTAVPEPTLEPTPTPVEEPTPEPTPEPEPTQEPTAEPPPTPEATADPAAPTEAQVVVLATVEPTASPTSTPTPLPTAEPVPAEDGAQSTAPPTESQELAAVTITVDDGGSLFPYALASLGLLSAFCLGMGIKSARRKPSGQLL